MRLGAPLCTVLFSPTEALINRTTGTNIGNMTQNGGLAASFDGNTSQGGAAPSAISAADGYVGKTYSAGKRFSRAVVHGSNNNGFQVGGAAITLKIYGKNGTPANRTDGTELATLSFTSAADESAGRELLSTDTVSSWTSLWVSIDGSSTTYCAELVLYELRFGAV